MCSCKYLCSLCNWKFSMSLKFSKHFGSRKQMLKNAEALRLPTRHFEILATAGSWLHSGPRIQQGRCCDRDGKKMDKYEEQRFGLGIPHSFGDRGKPKLFDRKSPTTFVERFASPYIHLPLEGKLFAAHSVQTNHTSCKYFSAWHGVGTKQRHLRWQMGNYQS